jgi:hypothetical protein
VTGHSPHEATIPHTKHLFSRENKYKRTPVISDFLFSLQGVGQVAPLQRKKFPRGTVSLRYDAALTPYVLALFFPTVFYIPPVIALLFWQLGILRGASALSPFLGTSHFSSYNKLLHKGTNHKYTIEQGQRHRVKCMSTLEN